MAEPGARGGGLGREMGKGWGAGTGRGHTGCWGDGEESSVASGLSIGMLD